MERFACTKIAPYTYEIPKTYKAGMLVPARFYASEEMLDDILGDESLEQLVNVASLPTIVKYSLGMPDIHRGYGSPVGGVSAFTNVISPGITGFDINCGVRLLTLPMTADDINSNQIKFREFVRLLYRAVPSGVGESGHIKLNDRQMESVLREGVRWLVKQGWAFQEDLAHTEEQGRHRGAKPEYVSNEAKRRGRDQLGTLGAGNHFLEIQKIEKIFLQEEAKNMGLEEGRAAVMIHCGSRGLGHQVCSDYTREALRNLIKRNVSLPDRELAYAEFDSPLGQRYFGAMAAAANFAWSNRQLIAHRVRQICERVYGIKPQEVKLVYDIAHNLAKIEKHTIQDTKYQILNTEVIVHRKGATRAFPGEPVLIPGSMGTASYVLVGMKKAMEESFGSSCHGAGRVWSRAQAKRNIQGANLRKELEARGIVIEAGSLSGLAEEAPKAYKDVDEVVEVVDRVGIARKAARLKPMGVIKG
ncbi:MAG: RtcB family protein [Candidatus Portnoybacteria bacterium]|nr:RtcB family protein [Candidatus Portnoybacteria bacterium]